jgi:hypothetical protein
MLLGFNDERLARLDLCSVCTEMPNGEMAPATNSCLDNDHLRCFMLSRVTLTDSFSSHTGFLCATCASVVGCVVEQQELLSTSGIYVDICIQLARYNPTVREPFAGVPVLAATNCSNSK